MRDLTLVPGLALQGVALGSHLIIDDNDVWRRVISSLVRALTYYILLVVEMLLGEWQYHRT